MSLSSTGTSKKEQHTQDPFAKKGSDGDNGLDNCGLQGPRPKLQMNTLPRIPRSPPKTSTFSIIHGQSLAGRTAWVGLHGVSLAIRDRLSTSGDQRQVPCTDLDGLVPFVDGPESKQGRSLNAVDDLFLFVWSIHLLFPRSTYLPLLFLFF